MFFAHKSTAAIAESVKQRNFRTIPFAARQVAKISRKATLTPEYF